MTPDRPTGPATDGIPDAEVRMTYQMFCDALLAERARILAALPEALRTMVCGHGLWQMPPTAEEAAAALAAAIEKEIGEK